MGLTTIKIFKDKGSARFYYSPDLYRGVVEVEWVCVTQERSTKNHQVVFGIKGRVPNSKKFNKKVKQIIKALILNPLDKLTIIDVKDINENYQTIIKFIKETKNETHSN